MWSQSALATLGPITNGPSCVTRQAGVSTIIFHHPLSAGGRETSGTAIVADLFLTGQVGQEGPGQGQLTVPESGGQGRGCRFLHRWWEGGLDRQVMSRGHALLVPSLWPELISIAALCLHIMLGPKEANNRKSLQVPTMESDQLKAESWLCYFLAMQPGASCSALLSLQLSSVKWT